MADTTRRHPPDLALLDRWFRATNYLAVGQIYLLDNPLVREPLAPEHVKARLLGHWGTCPGLNLVHAHLNRVVIDRGLDALFICGPGHGGPSEVAHAWLEGTYSELFPHVRRDLRGMRALFRQFSFPGGVPSHAAPEVPGSIHEGGELGYSLAHAYGAAFDDPDLVVACVIGDGEAETGALATSWQSTRFLDPVHDGAVLPILHLNGYKIANPTVMARIPEADLRAFLESHGHEPTFVAGSDPMTVHEEMAAAMDAALDRIAEIQHDHREGRPPASPPRWPALVLRTPKGWTGPATVDGLPVEDTWRSHQVPLSSVRTNAEHLEQLEAWLRSYRPEELFDDDGPAPDLAALIPQGTRRTSASTRANGGLRVRSLDLPDVRDHAVEVPYPGAGPTEATRALGGWLRDLLVASEADRNLRIFGPDETRSNRLGDVFDVTGTAWQAEILDTDEDLARDGRVMEVLSEHLCQGWLEGYLLTGRHGLFSCYEAFTHIVDSMVSQHIKWLKVAGELEWRAPVPSLTYLLTSHVWRQDHNGFSHQDPGFIDHVANKDPDVVRVYLPPDANTLLVTAERCLRSRNLVNVVVAGKQPGPAWLDIDAAELHCARGIGVWDWASSDDEGDPDVVLACAGDVPTMEVLAAVSILRRELPELAVRVVNVVDLMRLQPDSEHPHGMSDREFDTIFTTDRPIVFAYHGYPMMIHKLAYRRTNHGSLHVRGYKEEGTTTTPFDMVMLNDLDRYHLVMDVIDRVPGLGSRAARLRQAMIDARHTARAHTRTTGEDLPEVTGWSWEG
jgi:xylulose-5-phosphate/fructose-6-phosphate phosphoketolase